jgi:hypothetical protein
MHFYARMDDSWSIDILQSDRSSQNLCQDEETGFVPKFHLVQTFNRSFESSMFGMIVRKYIALSLTALTKVFQESMKLRHVFAFVQDLQGRPLVDAILSSKRSHALLRLH